MKARQVLGSLALITSLTAEGGYLVAGAPPEQSGELTKALALQGVFVTEMAPVQLSLERFFLEVTDEGGEATRSTAATAEEARP